MHVQPWVSVARSSLAVMLTTGAESVFIFGDEKVTVVFQQIELEIFFGMDR